VLTYSLLSRCSQEVAHAEVILKEVLAAAITEREAIVGDGESGRDVEELGIGGSSNEGGEQREGARLGGGVGAKGAVPADEVLDGDLGDGDPGVRPERRPLVVGQVERDRRLGQ
jgi:hypothetical protein